MPEEQKKHPLEEYSEDEQIAYLSVLSAVCYVDKEFGDMEKRQLDVLLAQLKISDVGKAKIYSSVFNLQREDKLANLEAIQILGNTELKYTLISDLCLFSLVDSKFSDDEYQYILGIGEVLGITQEQVDAIKSIQENLDKIKDIPSNSERFKRVIKDSASTLAGVGVPIGAIAVSGSVFGLSAAGITSGLAALGALVGGGMLLGAVVVVPAIALGTAYGVKKLFDAVWKGLGLKPPVSVVAEVQESWKNAADRRADVWPQGDHITWMFPGNDMTDEDLLPLEWFDGEFYPPAEIMNLLAGKEYPAESAMLIGTDGALLIPHGGTPVLLPEDKFVNYKSPEFEAGNHYHSFVVACLGGPKTESHFAQSGPMTEAILLGTVAIREPGTRLEWNSDKMKFPNFPEAEKYLRRNYRRGWKTKEF